MITKKIFLPFAILFIALFSSCANDDFVQIDGVCPVVETTSPENGAINVPLDKTISVNFNEEMDAATFSQSSFTIQGTNLITGTVSINGTIVSFMPTSPLMPNTTYTGIINTSVKDKKGNALQEDYVWTFSTGSTVTPMVVSSDPANNAIDVFLNKIVSANFNMLMNHSSINATTFTLKQGADLINGMVTYVGQTAYFKSSSPLLAEKIYTATITTGAKNIQGTPLANDFSWEFTTGTILGPSVISTDPLDNATGVALDKIVTATFSMEMDIATINNTSFTLKNGTILINGAINYVNSTLTFVPDSPLLEGTIYTATITTDAKNLAGIPLANNYVWEFSTLSTLTGTLVNLGSVEEYGIIAGVGVSNNAGFSEIRNMNVGIYPGVRTSVTGFPPAIIVNGAIHASDDIEPLGIAATLLQAKNDLTSAYLFAEGASSPAPATVAGDQGGKTLAPGIYKSTSTLLIESGDLTLDAQGDANAVWIFQIASDFTTVGGAGGDVILAGGAQAKNVFWQVGRSATIGDYTIFKGNVLALTSITMNAYATAEGRMLARNGAVIMTHTNIITKP
ncbi:Ig-like domain-containing protein [Lutibacter sp.]|uniref:Ig-like domain-containing protein n=1 Tax=Lutibacter sp. TaxID=1925666 RepID=UPI0035673D92